MCSKRINSVRQNKSAAILRQFTWDSLMKELTQHAPTLLHVLKGRTLTCRKKENQDATICLCAAILLRFRNRNMNLLQRKYYMLGTLQNWYVLAVSVNYIY